MSGIHYRLVCMAALIALPFVTFVATAQEEGAGADGPCNVEGLPRPSTLLGPERLEALRTEIRDWPWKRQAYAARFRANADRWLARTITVPERAGYLHNFYCTDGVRLAVPEDQIFTSNTYTCPACGKTYSGERYDGGRRFLEHRWRYQACRDLAIVAAVEQDPRYAAKAAELLEKYADAYPGRHTSATEGGIMYQSLDEAVMMIPFAGAYDLIHDMGVLSDAAKEHIAQDLLRESAEGLMKVGSGGNWGSWHLSAVGVVGVAIRDQRLIDYAVDRFKAQIANELGTDGLWPESVHTYHFYPLRAFIQLAEACANVGIDLYHWTAPNGNCLRDMFTAPINYAYPSAQLPAINDGWYESWLPPGQYEAAYYRYGRDDIAWALQRALARYPRESAEPEGRKTYLEPWGVLLGRPLPDTITAPALVSTDFDNIGICVLRNQATPSIVATFDYGRHLGHGQFDKMGITLFANDRVLAADYGTPGYGSAILPYYRGATSHNTIIIQGEGQQPTKTGKLEAFQVTDAYTLATATDTEAYPGTNWRRSLLLTDRYLLVMDSLTADTERSYDFFFHSEGDHFAVEDDGAPVEITALGSPYVHDVRRHTCAGDTCRAEWGFDDGTGLLLVQTSDAAPDGVFSARTPAETAARQVPLFVARRTGHTVNFVTLLVPFARRGDMAETGVRFDPAGRVEIVCGGVVDQVSFEAGLSALAVSRGLEGTPK